MRVTIASYNIHGGVGSDGRFDLLRTLRVLQALGADVIALQEVAARQAGGRDTLAYLAEETGMHAVAGPTLRRGDGHGGNALLTRWPVLSEHRLDLSFPGREPRGALGVTVDCPGRTRLQVVTTHLGLHPRERRYQVRRLLELFEIERVTPAVLLGDLNEWLLWGQPLRWLHAYFKRTPAPATFPARFPLFALDRVWVRPRSALLNVAVNAGALARRASDHLPVTAVLECPPMDLQKHTVTPRRGKETLSPRQR